MNICELFDELQESILDELKGELSLHGNCIVWSYNLDNDNVTEDMEVNDDDDNEYDFVSATSPEELLQETYEEDLEVLQAYLAQLDDFDNWTYSEPEVSDMIISFKIF